MISVPIINQTEIEKYSNLYKHCNLLVIEENIIRGGFGSLIFEIFGKEVQQIRTIGLRKIIKEVAGSEQYMRKIHGIDRISIKEKIVKFLSSTN